jgi:hypothetical protein
MGGSPSTTCTNWHELKCPCPVPECRDSDAKNWAHAICGNKVYLNSEAYCKCDHHGTFCCIIDCRWECSNHRGDFRKGDVDMLLHALTFAASIAQAEGDKVWASNVIKAIIKMK